MTKVYFRPELVPLAKAFMEARQKLGYKRATMGQLLGFTGRNRKKVIRYMEEALLPIPQPRLAQMHEYITNGVPDHYPKPDLAEARARVLLKLQSGRMPKKKPLPTALKPSEIIIITKKEQI